MIEFLLSFVWYIRILRNILSYVNLWYVKEYRIDRMLIHLRTQQGKRIFFPERKEPPVSPKTVVLVILLVISTLSLIYYMPLPLVLRVLLADLLTFPISFLFIAILWIPTFVYHQYKIAKARERLSSHKPLMTVGITGSFGKTSTKDFLAVILKEKYKVLKTEESKNSLIGISETILSQVSPAHNAFVVEMGAYKRGEIDAMAGLVHPNVAIITAINAQHQDLFKGLETTKKAKYELIERLPLKGGIAVMNLDNAFVREMASWAIRDGITVWGVTTDASYHGPVKNILYVSEISSSIDSLTFVCTWKDKHGTVKVPLRGEHFAINIALAVTGAMAAGLTFTQAIKGAGHVHPVHRVMEFGIGKKGQRLINDTFNNNPDAAKAALMYLKKFGRRRILVFQPMIELGSYSDAAHVEIGKLAASICDAIILTNANFSASFIRGVKKENSKKYVAVLSKEDATSYILKHSGPKDTVLFKGKEAAFVFSGIVRTGSSSS